MYITCAVSRGTKENKVVLADNLGQELDFSNCTQEELEELASKTIVIKLQAIWRELDSKALEAEHDKVLDVHEFINRPSQRKPSDPVKAVLNKDMTEEELANLIAKLQAKMTK